MVIVHDREGYSGSDAASILAYFLSSQQELDSSLIYFSAAAISLNVVVYLMNRCVGTKGNGLLGSAFRQA